jgi:N-acetylneuraminate synthase
MKNNKIFIIAEIGINHNGDMKIAKQLIDMAKDAGCDAVKFQKRDLNIVYSKEELNSDRESPWGGKFIDQKKGLEFQKPEFDEINKYCKDIDIEWFASAWDSNSLKFLDQYNLKYNKIASALITHKEFLNDVAKRKKYTFISTGMSTYQMIDDAVEIFKKNDCLFELMHCVSAYPCPEEILNLNIIERLKQKYNCKVGYSGHEAGVVPSVVAATYGISSLERHITLDRSMYGSDQAASLAEPGLRNLVNSVKKVSVVKGSLDKKIFDQEIPVAKKLRYWEKN